MDFMNASGVIFGVHNSIDSSMLRENLKSHEAYCYAKKLRNQLQELKSQAKTKKRNDLLGSLNSIIQGHRLRCHDICDAYLSTPTDSAWKDALCDEILKLPMTTRRINLYSWETRNLPNAPPRILFSEPAPLVTATLWQISIMAQTF
jgi:hypothetical protein